MGETVPLSKRLLIEGEGQLGEAVIDQRANAPMFRITGAGVVLRNIDLDQTGFREALLVEGGASVRPLLDGCRVRCSGDDAVNVTGRADPYLRGCELTGRKCGVRAFGEARGLFERCTLTGCGEQGVKAMESAAPALSRCTISDCGEEGAVAMDSSRLTLHACTMSGCKGPGLDASGAARVRITGGAVEGCVGGVFLWGSSRALLRGATLAGGPCHALLVDGLAMPDAQGCLIRGHVHAGDSVWERLLDPKTNNRLEDTECGVDLPPESGPFVFEPNQYTRKQ